MDLVIVESPTKARTLKRFLGEKYQIEATWGHVRDLPKNELGVDIEGGFVPVYEIVPGRKKRVNELAKKAKEASGLILATDPDREGEAIAWHLIELIKQKDKKYRLTPQRIVFHEITQEAIDGALKQLRPLDLDLVNAQQARRVLDRLVGYKLSPLLWQKVRAGLSAGRVQSVAVRLVVERQKERDGFVPKESWDLVALLFPQGNPKDLFEAKLVKVAKRKPNLPNQTQAESLVKKLEKASWQVLAVMTSQRTRNPYPPLTTSGLQRTAASQLGFSANQTMRLAQSLYEKGLITYHRTDSTNLANSAVEEIRKLVKSEFGPNYLPDKSRVYRTKVKVAQEAHEAIRPTQVRLKEPKLSGKYASHACKLYDLIRKRTVACQMEAALYQQTGVEIEADAPAVGCQFKTSSSTLIFDGWLKVIPAKDEQTEERSKTADERLPELKKGEKLQLKELKAEQHFTQPPPLYTEAALIKALEERGIGRPSTYAPILSTIQERGYVIKEAKNLLPTPTGEVVTELLVEHFPKIVDYDFTAELEEELDEIARGERVWVKVLETFYQPFAENLAGKFTEIKRGEVVVRRQLEEKCPECSSPLVVKLGRFGEFVSCSAFPECHYSRPLVNNKGEGGRGDGDEGIDENQLKDPCPECGGKLVLKEGRFGKFIACSNYPDCKHTQTYQDKIGMKCPQCEEGEIVRKKSRRGKTFYGCSRYPRCQWASWEKPK